MLFLFVVPKIYLLGSILVIIGVTCLGSSFVLLNSFLPLLVLNHPFMQGFDPLSSRENSREVPETGSSGIRLSTKISSKGVGLGYMAAVFVQCLSIMLLYSLSKTSLSSSSPTVPLRLVLFVVGLWWATFTVLPALWLRDRPGPPLKAAIPGHASKWRSYVAYIAFSWTSLWRTIKVASKLRQAVVFLIAWFLLSDAIATVSGTAILFARTELKMGTVEIALLSITVTSSGIAGAFAWPSISRKLALEINRTILACIMIMEIIPLYGLMGYVPFIQAWGVGGLQQAWEIYPLGVIYGFVMGGLSSYCRSFFGLLIPPGSEAAFYALYAITDKGSSAVGPAVVGAIVDATGHIRPAFAFLAVLIALPVPLIWSVNVERGRGDAIQMAGLLKASRRGSDGLDVQLEDRSEEAQGLMANHL